MLSIWVFCLRLGEGWVVCEGVQLGELTRSQKTHQLELAPGPTFLNVRHRVLAPMSPSLRETRARR